MKPGSRPAGWQRLRRLPTGISTVRKALCNFLDSHVVMCRVKRAVGGQKRKETRLTRRSRGQEGCPAAKRPLRLPRRLLPAARPLRRPPKGPAPAKAGRA